MKLTPFFEIDGQRYEIRKTRYLLAEYNKLANESELSNADKANAIKSQALIGDVQKYGEKTLELEQKYFETFDDEDERKYLKAKALYDKALAELTVFETETQSTALLEKAGFDLLEKIAIKGLAEQYFDGNEVKGTELWEKFANTLKNQNQIKEWLSYMSDCLFNEESNEVDENSFLSQMRQRAEEKAKNRNKIKMRR